MAEVAIRQVELEDDLETVARIITTVRPDEGVTVDQMRWADRTYPGGARFVGLLDGEPAGAAGIGRVYSYGPDFPGLWANVAVLPGARRHGLGSALYAAVSEHARSAGKELLVGRTTEDEADALAFLAHRGFAEWERMKAVRLELAGLAPPADVPPDGIEITSLEARPDLAPMLYEVAREALADIPGDAPPQLPDTIEGFLARDVEAPSIPPWGYAVAVEVATGRPVGYASLSISAGSPTLGWHEMTGVARAWRGRGLAGLLKRATIRAAMEHGLEALEAHNDIDNAAMRTVNRRLGYRPLPDAIMFRGPLAPLRETAAAGPAGAAS